MSLFSLANVLDLRQFSESLDPVLTPHSTFFIPTCGAKRHKKIICIHSDNSCINVMRKNAKAAIHFLTKGPITQEIFTYPMGGAWYKQISSKPKKKNGIEKLEQYINNLIKSLFE